MRQNDYSVVRINYNSLTSLSLSRKRKVSHGYHFNCSCMLTSTPFIQLYLHLTEPEAPRSSIWTIFTKTNFKRGKSIRDGKLTNYWNAIDTTAHALQPLAEYILVHKHCQLYCKDRSWTVGSSLSRELITYKSVHTYRWTTRDSWGTYGQMMIHSKYGCGHKSIINMKQHPHDLLICWIWRICNQIPTQETTERSSSCTFVFTLLLFLSLPHYHKLTSVDKTNVAPT